MIERVIWVQECEQSKKRRRVTKAIDAQWEELNKRALKPHDLSCAEPSFCEKNPCFVWEPDTIVSEPYTVVLKK